MNKTSPDMIYTYIPTTINLYKPYNQNTNYNNSYNLYTHPKKDTSFGYYRISYNLDTNYPNDFTYTTTNTIKKTTNSQYIPTNGNYIYPPNTLPKNPKYNPPTNNQNNDNIPNNENNYMTHPNPNQENFNNNK